MRSRVFLIFLVAFSLVAFAATEWNPMLFKSAVDIEAGPLTVGGVTPNAASLMELQSTTQGSIFAPKMTTVQRDAIATPPSGLTIFNADSDAYNFYDGTSWTEIGSGAGGSAGLNYYEDFDADDINNLTEFDDTAVGGDLTGGSASNLSITSNTSTPINKLASYRISKSGADASWEGVNISFSGTEIDELAKSGRPFIFSFNYETSANYNAGTEAVSVYYFRVGTDSAAQACNGRTLGGSVSNTLGVATTAQSFSCSFNLASTTTAVRIAWVVTGTGTSTWDLDIDNIYFGPDFQVPGVIVTDWQSFTMSITGATSDPTKATTRDEGAWFRRVGDEMEVSYFYRHTSNVGAAAGSGVYRFNFPTAANCTPDTSKIVSSNGGLFVVGSAAGYFGGSDNTSGVAVLNGSATYFQLSFGDNATGDQTAGSAYKPLNSATAYYAFKASVPCTAYANQSASLSTTQVDLQTIKVNASATASQALTADVTNLQYESEVTDTHNAWDGTQFTAPITATYDVNGIVRTGTSSQKSVSAYINGTIYRTLNTNAASGVIAKYSGIIPLNRGDVLSLRLDVSETKAASVNATNWITIEARPNFSTFGVYGLYEYTEAIVSADVTAAVAGTVYDATGASITVTPGTWNVCIAGSIYYDWVSGSSIGQTCKAFVRDSANTAIGAHLLTNKTLSNNDDNATIGFHNCVEVSPTTTTTYKMSLQCSNASSAAISYITSNGFSGVLTDPDTQSKIWARRMK